MLIAFDGFCLRLVSIAFGLFVDRVWLRLVSSYLRLSVFGSFACVRLLWMCLILFDCMLLCSLGLIVFIICVRLVLIGLFCVVRVQDYILVAFDCV